MLNKILLKVVDLLSTFLSHKSLYKITSFCASKLSGTLAFSLEGEDLILKHLFQRKKDGFYVDVGANNPTRFSNTYLFYQNGWKGINIDPLPGCMKQFDKQRSRDINIEVAISSDPGEKTYYRFSDDALNTLSSESAEIYCSKGWKIRDKIMIKTERLDRILENHLPIGIEIDFLSIDVEGHEISVLESNDWNHFRPKAILVEQLDSSIDEIIQSRMNDFLSKKGYYLFAKTVNTLIYLRSDFERKVWKKNS